MTISVTAAEAQKYAREIVDLFTGETVISRMAPVHLSCIIRRFEQNETVTQLTARREETSCAPTVPFISASLTLKPCGIAETKLSR